jgi:very-short-patch-repair endonuclease
MRTKDPWRRSLRFAGLWLPEAVVSHEAAGLLHGLDGVETAPVEVLVSSWRVSRRGVKLHVGEVAGSEITQVDGFRVTTVERTLLDLRPRLSEEKLSWAVEHAWRRGDTNPMKLRVLLEACRRHGMEGVVQLDAVLRDCQTRIRPLESALEMRMWRALSREGLVPETQFTVGDAEGETRIDFAFLYERIALETMGKKSHEGEANLERDSRRALRLSGLGWTVIPVTRDMLEENTPRVLGQIRESLRTHDPRFVRRGFASGQLGLPEHYLVRPQPQLPQGPRPVGTAIVVGPTPRRPEFGSDHDGIDDPCLSAFG